MGISSDIIQIVEISTDDICKGVAAKVKDRRLELNLTQSGLAARAGVNIETYRKFERTGQISFNNLVKIGNALNLSADFNLLFAQRQYQSIDELLESETIVRKRGKNI